MYAFWYDYSKYIVKEKLCYPDTDSFVIYTKNIIFIKILQKSLSKKTLSELHLILQIMKKIDHCLKENKNVIWLRKDELGRQILKKFVGLGAENQIVE